MSDVFVDTSAVIALLVESDVNHAKARRAFEHLAAEEARLMTTSYVLVETTARLRSRVGQDAVHRLRVDFEPLLAREARHPGLVRRHNTRAAPRGAARHHAPRPAGDAPAAPLVSGDFVAYASLLGRSTAACGACHSTIGRNLRRATLRPWPAFLVHVWLDSHVPARRRSCS